MSKKQIEKLRIEFFKRIDETFICTNDPIKEIFEDCLKNLYEKKVESKLFPKMTDIYNDFCKDKIGVSGKFGAKECKALKSIIKYLESNVKNKEGGEEAIADAWQFVLKNVDRWDRFHQGQLTLNQIDSNFINILNSIKNGHNKPKPTETKSVADRATQVINELHRRRSHKELDENKHSKATQL